MWKALPWYLLYTFMTWCFSRRRCMMWDNLYQLVYSQFLVCFIGCISMCPYVTLNEKGQTDYEWWEANIVRHYVGCRLLFSRADWRKSHCNDSGYLFFQIWDLGQPEQKAREFITALHLSSVFFLYNVLFSEYYIGWNSNAH